MPEGVDWFQRYAGGAGSAAMRLDDPAPEDRRVLEAIGAHNALAGRRPLPLLDIAWSVLGTESAARASLQRLILDGLIRLAKRRGTTADCVGWLTENGARLLADRQATDDRAPVPVEWP
jgi:hypothetical protein